MSPPTFPTPVALLIFNRPETTRRVFAVVRQMRPARLLVVADGPRSDRVGEAELCAHARAIIDDVDWPCLVQTEFAEINLGCMRRVSSGLDWVFTQVEEAIILEDDCLPDLSFFPYCAELLDRFREEPRIAQIGGVNFQFGRQYGTGSYFFSNFTHVWGWATWRRAWVLNDSDMHDWPAWRDRGGLKTVMPGPAEVHYWSEVLDQVAAGAIDSWACRWALSCWSHGLLTVLPSVNLVSNIGFGPAATHTTEESRFAGIPLGEMHFPLRHPERIAVNRPADALTGRLMFRPLTFLRKLGIFLRGYG